MTRWPPATQSARQHKETFRRSLLCMAVFAGTYHRRGESAETHMFSVSRLSHPTPLAELRATLHKKRYRQRKRKGNFIICNLSWKPRQHVSSVWHSNPDGGAHWRYKSSLPKRPDLFMLFYFRRVYTHKK